LSSIILYYSNQFKKLAHNVQGIRRLGGLMEPA